MTQPNLITVTGNLRDGYNQLQPGTMRHVDELTDERRNNPIDAEGTDLRRVGLYTADGELYSVRKGVPTLSMTRGDVNPVLDRIDDAFAQLTTSGNFRPNREDMERALGAYSTVHNDLSKLRLQGNDAEWQYIVFPTKKNHGLRYDEEKLARRVFGDDTFKENMEMFREAGIIESRIYVLNPAYVREHASESPVGRGSWLINLFDDFNFLALDRSINIHDRSRGVRREVSAEGAAARKLNPVVDDVLACLGNDIAPSVRPQLEGRIRKLYNS